MDAVMASVGVASGIITCVDSCIQSYKAISSFISTMREMGKEGAELEAIAIVEENKLRVWARVHDFMIKESRRDETVRDYLLIPSTAKSVASVLASIETTQKEAKKVIEKYQLQAETVMNVEGPQEATFYDLESPTENPQVSEVLEIRISRSKTIGSGKLKRKVTWAMKDMQHFKKCLSSLRDLNNELYSWTMPSLHILMYDAVISSIPRLGAATSLEGRVAALEMYTNATGLHPRGKEELEAQIQTWKVDAQREEVKATHSIPVSSIRGLMSYNTSNPRERCLAEFISEGTSRNIIIEWRAFNPRKITVDEVRSRLNGLVGLLKSAPKSVANVLSPIGFFEDSRLDVSTAARWFGIAYEKIRLPINRPTVIMRTLESLIERPEQPSDPRLPKCKRFPTPPLGQRFRLARRLSETLLSIHNCGWLHKGIRPGNVVFFASPEIDFDMPYLLGWEYSRKDASSEQTETVISADSGAILYQHPDHARGQYYRQEFDQYQLGCILLEIAYWESLSYLRTKLSFQLDPGSEEWKDELIKDARLLKRDMGEIYSSVVVALLQGLIFGERIGEFWADVVFELYKCNA